jgi:hypothetical protein
MVMGEIDETARRLLREMGHQAEANPSGATDVAPKEAAENLEVDPQGPEYAAALNHLLALGDIERVSKPGGRAQATGDLYRLTLQGLRRAKEMH